MNTRSRIALAASAALVSLGLAFAPSLAQDKMSKDDGMKMEDTMSKDAMKKDDGMKKDAMKPNAMSDGMKKDDATARRVLEATRGVYMVHGGQVLLAAPAEFLTGVCQRFGAGAAGMSDPGQFTETGRAEIRGGAGGLMAEQAMKHGRAGGMIGC